MSDEGDDRPGFREISEVMRDPDLSPESKVLWMIYRSYEGPHGKGAYPGDDLLAEHIDRSPRTVRRHRAHLVEAGYLNQELRGPRAARYWTTMPEDSEGEPPDEPDREAPWGHGELPDGDGFPSRFFVDGVREVLWKGEEPPEKASQGWTVRAELPDLRTAHENIGTEALVRRLWGLRYLAEDGELPGVEPGEGFTLGLLRRLRGNGLWQDAEDAYSRRHDEEKGGSVLEDAVAEALQV